MNSGRDVDGLIDTALDTYPLAALPAGFTARTMTRVRAESLRRRAVGTTVPRLGFLDFALPAFGALFTFVAIAAAWLVWLTGNPVWWSAHALGLKLTWLTWTARGAAFAPGAAAAAVAGTVLAGVALVAWLTRPCRGCVRPS
jgi:hypothetical protein